MATQKSERGQILILLVLAIVGLFGMAALAVDVGRVFAERRRAQNAADAAAYAAAFSYTQNKQASTARSAALVSAQKNGFNDASYLPDLGSQIDVQVHNPPISGRYSIASETINPAQYYQVIIRSTIAPIFAQFVFGGPLTVEVEAVARGTTSHSFSSGFSLAATCPNCCNALQFAGTADVLVDGGNIVSNSNATGSSCPSAVREGNPCIELTTGTATAVGTFLPGGNENCRTDDGTTHIGFSPAPISNSGNAWYATDPGMPSCDDPSLADWPNSEYSSGKSGPTILKPGRYPNGIHITGAKSVVQFEKGLYCLKGDLWIESGQASGSNVMFVMQPNANVFITTNQAISFSAPAGTDAIIDPKTGYPWSGFVIYMPYANSGAVYIAGGGGTTFTGTIYAPGPLDPDPSYLPDGTPVDAKCTIRGNSDVSNPNKYNGSIICYTVEVGGTGAITLRYFDETNAQKPALVELTK